MSAHLRGNEVQRVIDSLTLWIMLRPSRNLVQTCWKWTYANVSCIGFPVVPFTEQKLASIAFNRPFSYIGRPKLRASCQRSRNGARYQLIYSSKYAHRLFQSVRRLSTTLYDEEVLQDQISCTIYDANGKVEAVSQKFPKREFILGNGLNPRDIRHIETSKTSIVPSILVRPDAILVCLLDIRAVIKYDRVLLVDDFDGLDTKKFGVFVYNLSSALRNPANVSPTSNVSGLPYEMRALEAILMYVVASLETDLKSHLDTLNAILQSLEDHVEHSELRELLVRDKALTKFYQKSRLVGTTISKLLDNDEDLSVMFLTDQNKGIQRESMDHAESELLLESYYKQVDEIVQQAERIHNNIKNTEEIINIMLDANRNSLMVFELRITIAILGFSVGVFFAALYGMNLKNYLEESHYGLVAVTVALSAVALLITIFNLKTLVATQKATLSSDKFRGSKKQRHAMLTAMKSRRYDEKQRVMMWKWLVERK